MRPAELHERTLPTKYSLWLKYVGKTEYSNDLGIEFFIEVLNQRQAIELVNYGGTTLCKTLNESLIKATVPELYSRPYQLAWSLYSHKLARLLNRGRIRI